MTTINDGGPDFVAVVMCSAELDNYVERWERTIPLRGDETIDDLWVWASRGSHRVDNLRIHEADAMLAERAKGGGHV